MAMYEDFVVGKATVEKQLVLKPNVKIGALVPSTVAGIRSSNTALAALLTALATLGLITDTTTAT